MRYFIGFFDFYKKCSHIKNYITVIFVRSIKQVTCIKYYVLFAVKNQYILNLTKNKNITVDREEGRFNVKHRGGTSEYGQKNL
jgi:hypothetical protein